MNDLKPCPFCGNDKIKVKSRYVRNFSVVRVSRFQAHCTRCHSRGATITGAYRYSWIVGVPDWVSKYVKIEEKEALEQKAIEAWNRRASDE